MKTMVGAPRGPTSETKSPVPSGEVTRDVSGSVREGLAREGSRSGGTDDTQPASDTEAAKTARSMNEGRRDMVNGRYHGRTARGPLTPE